MCLAVKAPMPRGVGISTMLFSRYRGLVRRYKAQDDGVVAVEFALLAIPLFVLIIGAVEMSLFFAGGVVLEGAASDAARLIRTGQSQTSENPEQVFADRLCEKVGVMIDCEDLQYQVIRMETDSFSEAENNQPEFDAEGNLIDEPFNAGNSNDVILIRAAYRYEFLTPFIGAMATGDPSRNWMNHLATVVIRAEPYNFLEE